MENQLFETRIYKILTYIVDFLLIIVSVYLSFFIKFGNNINNFDLSSFLYIYLLMIFSYIIFMYVFGIDDILKKDIGEIIYSISLTVICLIITTSFIAFFLQLYSYPRTVILISSIPQFISLSIWRYIVWKIIRKKHGIKDCLIVGNTSVEELTQKITIKQKDLYKIKYLCSDKSQNIMKYVNDVKVVFITSDVSYSTRYKILNKCIPEGKSVYIIPNSYEVMLLNSKLNRADDTPLLNLNSIGLTIEQRVMKRILDIIVSSIGLLITSPIMLIVAIAIKLSDGGHVFYGQERVTIRKKTFKVLKFRTMVINAEKQTGPVLAGENDPRITKIGRILRATRLDELPQFFNILKGDMSVVGPRPERPFFVEKFENQIEDYKYRTLVKAGLTGFAQIYGKYNTTAVDKAKYDLMYIKNYSIFLDLKLLLLTVKIMFIKDSTEGVKDTVKFSDFIKDNEMELVVDLESHKHTDLVI
ncbi:sugar transferase [Candidatus Clostridium radicumherbarum]|uniref:Sugar transferase n=1 Tax=Candidatus Clostridium radicumherbarum TaxID=3381662 RepID=A0ABW8TV84_9CLOT